MILSAIFKKFLINRSFSINNGQIKLFGKMFWTLLPAKSLAMTYQKIAEKNGPKFLYDLGYEAGHDAAVEMMKSMQLKLKGGWISLNAVLAMLDFIGFGKVEFTERKIEKDGHHHLKIKVTDNPVIENAKKMFGSKSMVCNWFLGVYSAHANMDLGTKNAHFKENKCFSTRHPHCEWETVW
ncbi:MAG: hypothetical protein KJ613_01645 [Nanoarchaeota archaeon]|nr:hypothetical protein [Nanoarchaeota archaeon]MBU1135079.1 hypothetical protein [Nanoarchaeota archaeon]